VSLVRTPNDFLSTLREIYNNYARVFRRELSELEARYDAASEHAKLEIRSVREAHIRCYLVNGLLAALNWRQDLSPELGLPNLVPEVAVRSEEVERRRFLDYLGFEWSTQRPLVVVETKRPGSDLPSITKPAGPGQWSTLQPDVDPTPQEVRRASARIIARGLSGDLLSGPWPEWLDTLRDYIRSVRANVGRVPQRVILTDGIWLVAFVDPFDAFVAQSSPNPDTILVYDRLENIDQTHACEIYSHLEYQQVAGRFSLRPVELPFRIRAQDVDRAMHGLRVSYYKQRNVYQVSPAISVAPVIFLHSRRGAWFFVETFSAAYQYALPHKTAELNDHLDAVADAAGVLLDDINTHLSRSLSPVSLSVHYDDADLFRSLPGVVECGDDAYLLATGQNTHYIRRQPSVVGCPFHEWKQCPDAGSGSNGAPIAVRKTDPRSFFISGELHHCAHSDVLAAKRSPVSDDGSCGSRSGAPGQAFCEIWNFENYLCCRTCAFEDVCTKAQIFRLPCSLSPATNGSSGF
jgi:hypothetical protein